MTKIRRSITIDPVLWSQFGRLSKNLKELGLLEADEGRSTVIENLVRDFVKQFSPKVEKIIGGKEEKRC